MTDHLKDRGIDHRIGVEIGCSRIDVPPLPVQEALESLNLARADVERRYDAASVVTVFLRQRCRNCTLCSYLRDQFTEEWCERTGDYDGTVSLALMIFNWRKRKERLVVILFTGIVLSASFCFFPHLLLITS